MSVNRDNIEEKRDAFAGGPEPGFQKVAEAQEEAEKTAEYPRGTGIPGAEADRQSHIVDQSGDLTEPVATESDSY